MPSLARYWSLSSCLEMLLRALSLPEEEGTVVNAFFLLISLPYTSMFIEVVDTACCVCLQVQSASIHLQEPMSFRQIVDSCCQRTGAVFNLAVLMFLINPMRSSSPNILNHSTLSPRFDKFSCSSYFSSPSNFLVNSADRVIRVFNIDQIMESEDSDEIEALQRLQDLVNRTQWKKCTFSGDGEFIVAGSHRQHALYIWDKATGSLVKMLTGQKGETLLDIAVSCMYM